MSKLQRLYRLTPLLAALLGYGIITLVFAGVVSLTPSIIAVLALAFVAWGLTVSQKRSQTDFVLARKTAAPVSPHTTLCFMGYMCFLFVGSVSLYYTDHSLVSTMSAYPGSSAILVLAFFALILASTVIEERLFEREYRAYVCQYLTNLRKAEILDVCDDARFAHREVVQTIKKQVRTASPSPETIYELYSSLDGYKRAEEDVERLDQKLNAALSNLLRANTSVEKALARAIKKSD